MLSFLSKNLQIIIYIIILIYGQLCFGNNNSCINFQENSNFIKNLKDEIDIILNDTQNKENVYKKLEKIVDSTIDKEEVAKFVLGSYWNDAPSSQKEKFVSEYGTYIKHIYINYLNKYHNYYIKIMKSRQLPNNICLVGTILTNYNNDNDFISLEFKISNKEEHFYITDLKINKSISILINQRSMVNNKIKESGFNKEKGINNIINYLANENSKNKKIFTRI